MMPKSIEEGLNPVHLGSDFEDFLKEEGLFEAVHVLAVNAALSYSDFSSCSAGFSQKSAGVLFRRSNR